MNRLAHNAHSPHLRGKLVQVVGHQKASDFDIARTIVRLIDRDGSLGDTYLVAPGLVISA